MLFDPTSHISYLPHDFTGHRLRLTAHDILFTESGFQRVSVLPCKDEYEILFGYLMKVVVEHRLAERMDGFEPVGVDKDFVRIRRISFNGVEQFVGGAAVKVTDQLEVNAVTVLMQ
jgi:hypothetical protein